ncbi:MAG: hypothetical protein ACM3XP_07900 [Nitrososphaerales archaeon]
MSISLQSMNKIGLLLPNAFKDSTCSHLSLKATLEPNTLKIKNFHAGWYSEDKKAIFLSSSLDKRSFTVGPTKIMDIEGNVKDIKIISKENDFVITVVEEMVDGLRVRAATGCITEEKKYDFKPCEKAQVEGDLINVYTTWTQSDSQDNSTDFVFFRPKPAEGYNLHPDTGEYVPDNEVEIYCTTMNHCTRLSVLNKQKK